MAATSATGTGPGESFGKQKPNNNASCGGDTPEETTKKVIKNGCYVSYKTRGYSSLKVGQINSIRVC
tara:strand:+ start:2114 stop:2314 length:201 start_codon:yes stop_codon:yes gene_type:complete